MKDFAKGFYTGAAWYSCKEGFKANRRMIDGGMCQRCHERLGYIVHHKIVLNQNNIKDPDVSLNWENLEYLCHECHNKEHKVFQTTERAIFDCEGNVIAIR